MKKKVYSFKTGRHSQKSLLGIFRIRNARGIKQAKGYEEDPLALCVLPLPPCGGSMAKPGRGVVKHSIFHFGAGGRRPGEGLSFSPSLMEKGSRSGVSLTNKRGICFDDVRFTPDLHPKWRSAFTLIELLIVVLIIGILAAIALPQYQLAVAKSRFANIKPIVAALKEAHELYYMEHGSYLAASGDVSKLDITLPCSTVQDKTVLKCDNYFLIDNIASFAKVIQTGYCPGHQQNWSPDCRNHYDFLYMVWLDHSTQPGRVTCTGVTNLGKAVCKGMLSGDTPQ